MLENKEKIENLLSICAAQGVTEKGVAIAREIITNPPARRVNSRSMSPNLTCRFPSRKMGMVIQAESRSLELPSIYMKEFDEAIIGYWDQPFHRPNLIYSSGGRKVRVSVTLDFFVISEGFVGFEECKPHEVLLKELSKSSGRYSYDEASGVFLIPPLADYLEGTGLGHRVVTDRHINSVYVENLALLYRHLDEPITSKDKQLWAIAQTLSDVSGGVRLFELEKMVNGLTRSSVLTAIAHKALYVDLHRQALKEPERVLVFATAGPVLKIPEELPVINSGSMGLMGSSADMRAALSRFKVIEQIIQGSTLKDVAEQFDISTRTIQRWMQAYQSRGLSGLEPNNRNKGCYGSKLTNPVEAGIIEVIEKFYLSNQARTPIHVYGLLVEYCKERNLYPPSRQAFFMRLKSISERKTYKIREGAKRAYQFTGYEGLELSGGEASFRSVSRYLERCHIDHTQADIQLVSADGVNLGRPWLTIITDEFTGLVMAVYLSFRKPATPAVMSAIRLMVARHQVFPEAIVVDGGKELESIYFETLIAKHRSAIISRKGKPRAGSSVERMYGAINTVFLDNLSGSNKLSKNVRQLSASHNPKSLAVWEAVEFYEALVLFIDEWNCRHPKAGGMSPDELRTKSIERFGIPETRKLQFDSDFLLSTLPAPKRPTVRLRRNEEIQVNRVSYWHGCLRTIPRSGVTADVRYDPFNLNYVYVFYQKEWIKFLAVRQQHRQLDQLESAIVAEIARQSLVVNEQAKKEVRSEIAHSVEKLNDQALKNHLVRSKLVAEKDSSGGNVEGGHNLHLEDEDLWLLPIPTSEDSE